MRGVRYRISIQRAAKMADDPIIDIDLSAFSEDEE